MLTHPAPPPAGEQIDWQDMYQKVKSEKEAMAAKYEKDIGPLARVAPAAAGEHAEVVASLRLAAKQIADAGHLGWGNACNDAADMLEADAREIEGMECDYTDQVMRAIAAEEKLAQQVSVPAWTATADKMPEPCMNVLAYNGKKQPIRAMWVPAKTLEASGDGDFGEYDEATDEMWWPEGWYETNAYEETHWLVDGPVTHWMPLPAAPQGAKP